MLLNCCVYHYTYCKYYCHYPYHLHHYYNHSCCSYYYNHYHFHRYYYRYHHHFHYYIVIIITITIIFSADFESTNVDYCNDFSPNIFHIKFYITDTRIFVRVCVQPRHTDSTCVCSMYVYRFPPVHMLDRKSVTSNKVMIIITITVTIRKMKMISVTIVIYKFSVYRQYTETGVTVLLFIHRQLARLTCIGNICHYLHYS